MSDFSGSTAAQNNLNQSQAFAAALQRAKQVKKDVGLYLKKNLGKNRFFCIM